MTDGITGITRKAGTGTVTKNWEWSLGALVILVIEWLNVKDIHVALVSWSHLDSIPLLLPLAENKEPVDSPGPSIRCCLSS